MANRAGKVQVGEAGERGRISLWLAYGVASGLTSLSLYQRRASHLRHGISFAVMKGSAGVLATAAWFPTASGPQGREEGFLFFLAVDKHMNGVINCCSIFGPDVYDDKPLASAFPVTRYDTTGIKKTQPAKERKTEKKATAITTTYSGAIIANRDTSTGHIIITSGITGTRLGWERGGMIQSKALALSFTHTIGKRDLH